MSLDRYSHCPGGTGKKIKFCACCSDILPQLEQLQRLLNGDQRLAALDQVRKLRAEHGDRASLLAIECLLEDELKQTEQHAATLAVFAEKYPGNPIVLAETALSRADAEGSPAAVEPLQRAIAGCTDHFPGRVFEAIGILGRMLIGEGLILSGRAHLVLELTLTGGQAAETAELLTRLSGANELPLLLRDDYRMQSCPPGSAVHAACEGAVALARRGAWLAAVEALEKISGAAPDEPSIWHNLGILKAYLADHAGAAAALRTFAALPVPQDDSVEAEALAQILSPQAEDDIDLLATSWTIADAGETQTRLGRSPLASPIRFDPASLAEDDVPPPLAVFRILNRPAPASSAELTLETVPQVVCDVAVFGRETDRAPRIEIIATRGSDLDEARAQVGAILSQTLESPEQQRVLRQVSATLLAMSSRLHLPDDCTPQQQRALLRQQRRKIIAERWPERPQHALGGRTPQQATEDPASRTALAAAVLNLELGTSRVVDDPDFVALRQRLGLPQPAPIDPSGPGFDVKGIPAPRLMRLEAAKLSDEALQMGFRRAAWLRHAPAINVLAIELTRRPNLAERDDAVDQAEAYALLAEVAEDSEARLRHLEGARQVALRRGESCARWDLAELAVAMTDGDPERIENVWNHILQRHAREPGVNEALMQLLVQAGLIDPATGAPLRHEGSSEELAAVGARPSSAASQIWTPESAAAAPAGGGNKPAIWTPGS